MMSCQYGKVSESKCGEGTENNMMKDGKSAVVGDG